MPAKLEEGTIFATRYRVVRCIATGGMGAVHEVVHVETNRRCALKVMHAHLFQSEEMRVRFKLEARIAANVDSEYIVDVFDAGVDEATQLPFLVMELLRGEELGERLKRLGNLPREDVVTYMQQAAWALDRTHAASIVHRDLKPQNLFLTIREDGTPRIKILDFGVAKLVAEDSTAAGATRSLGTPLYMPPEQFRASVKLTAAADIYALTLMTYTLLVGKAYWAEEAKSAGDAIAFAMLVMSGPQESAVRRASRHGMMLPLGFGGWFAKGTAADPAERFTSATEAVRALRAVMDAAGADIEPSTVMLAEAPMTMIPLPDRCPGIPSVAAPSQAGTSTSASAITSARVKQIRGPLVARAAAFGLSLIGLGAWLTVRPAGLSLTSSPGSDMVSVNAANSAKAAPTSSAATGTNSATPLDTSAAPAISSVPATRLLSATVLPPVTPSAAVPPIAPLKKLVDTASTAQAAPLGKPSPTTAKQNPPSQSTLLGPD